MRGLQGTPDVRQSMTQQSSGSSFVFGRLMLDRPRLRPRRHHRHTLITVLCPASPELLCSNTLDSLSWRLPPPSRGLPFYHPSSLPPACTPLPQGLLDNKAGREPGIKLEKSAPSPATKHEGHHHIGRVQHREQDLRLPPSPRYCDGRGRTPDGVS